MILIIGLILVLLFIVGAVTLNSLLWILVIILIVALVLNHRGGLRL